MRILRLKAVIHKTGLTRSTITRLIADDSFPPSRQIGRRSIGWVESDINEWLLERIEERDIANGGVCSNESFNPSQDQDITILRLSQVIHVTSLARSTIYKLMSSGLFPKPISLSERTVGWVEAEVDQWIDSLTDGCRFRHQIAQY